MFYMKKIMLVLFIFSASILLIKSSQAANGAPAMPVMVDQVTQVELGASTELMATLHSRSHLDITAGVNGRIAWLAEPGSLVQQGDVLVKMDLTPLKLMHLEQQAQLKRAQINLRYLHQEVQRLKKLKQSNSASQFQLDQTQAQYDLASTDIEIADLKLQQIADQIQRATVTAPFNGVITERIVRAGSDVNRSETLLKILDTEQLEVRVYVPIKYLGFVRKGHELAISASGQQIKAAISALIPSADAKSQTFEVRINIPNHLNEVWAAGQLVKVTVPTQAATPSLTVHRDALILRKDATYVVKVADDNTVHRLPVVVKQGTAERVSIEGDLRAGDKVAIRGAERLNEGQKVIVQ
ncbi:RND family efflux transporter, MFP subunit [Colwellia chukchiensis]|uniref:RND family efflux transporter, MFP subunit n=1 Tax=Colwellia chukchiensis TaxID=641665 RepID=A0A1H7TNE6_9GAMM|nr:efflux RND transporter periplasmic adaptor subunit [Colwellia chukchiensis]SEL86291.1 RND family efflux transporter, MFP subunit [Colwellia chukchiensis]